MIRTLDRWLFGFGSPLTLGVFRAVFGAIIFLGLLMLVPDFGVWFSETGLAPMRTSQQWAGDTWRVSLLFGQSDPALVTGIFALTILAAACTTLGLFTKLATILLALGMVTLHHRNPFILNGGDTMLRVITIYFAFMPVGAAFSLDRIMRSKKGKPVVESISLWPQRLIQIQMAIMYGTTVLHKTVGVHWLDGTAAWYPPHLMEFERFPVPRFLDHPPFLQFATWGTLLVEIALATLVFWRPARRWVLMGGLLLHAAIEYRFNIPMFAFISVALYICHYQGDEIAGWWSRLKARRSHHVPATP